MGHSSDHLRAQQQHGKCVTHTAVPLPLERARSDRCCCCCPGAPPTRSTHAPQAANAPVVGVSQLQRPAVRAQHAHLMVYHCSRWMWRRRVLLRGLAQG